jgi:tetratricopeptide (TPR) repeat protein
MEEEIRQLIRRGDFNAALPLARGFYTTNPGNTTAEILLSLVLSYLLQNEEALSLARSAYERSRNNAGRESLEAVNNYARLLFRLANYDEAVVVGREALELFQTAFGDSDEATLRVMENLSRYEMFSGDLEGAMTTIQNALDLWGEREDTEAMLSAMLTSMEILNRITLSRFIAFYGPESAKINEVKKRLGL